MSSLMACLNVLTACLSYGICLGLKALAEYSLKFISHPETLRHVLISVHQRLHHVQRLSVNSLSQDFIWWFWRRNVIPSMTSQQKESRRKVGNQHLQLIIGAWFLFSVTIDEIEIQVHDIQLDYYGRRLATCSSDCTVKIFDVVGEQFSCVAGEWSYVLSSSLFCYSCKFCYIP